MKPDIIDIADVHLRDDPPRCREDEFWQTQWEKIKWIRKLSEKYPHATVLCAGDLTHHWKSSPELISKAIQELPPMLVVPGQHDLPEHSLQNLRRSTLLAICCGRPDIQLLHSGHTVALFDDNNDVLVHGYGYHQSWDGEETHKNQFNILLWHKMVWHRKEPFPGAGIGNEDKRIIQSLKGQFNLVITGDNHQPFVYEKDKTTLINAGSVMRTEVGQMDHKPRAYLIEIHNLKTVEVEPKYIPIEKDVVSAAHLEDAVDEDILEEFLMDAASTSASPLDFVKRLRENMVKHKSRDSVVKVLDSVIARAQEKK